MKLKAMIADDEPLARERLRLLLCGDQDIVITAECRSGREVVQALRAEPVDVLFLDIQMPGNTGFEVIEQIGSSQMPVTVFVTAHNHYALKAFEVHALDYLTKPIEPERLKDTLARVKERIASKSALMAQEQLKSFFDNITQNAPQPVKYPSRFLVHNGTKDVLVPVDDVEWIEAADYYSCLHVGSKSFLLREPIKQLAERTLRFVFVFSRQRFKSLAICERKKIKPSGIFHCGIAQYFDGIAFCWIVGWH